MSTYLLIKASLGIDKILAEEWVDCGHRIYITYFKNKPLLLSEKGRWIFKKVFHVDGGMSSLKV